MPNSLEERLRLIKNMSEAVFKNLSLVLASCSVFFLNACGSKETAPQFVGLASDPLSSDVEIDEEGEQWDPNVGTEKVALPVGLEYSPIVEVFHYHPVKNSAYPVTSQFVKELLSAILHKKENPEDVVEVNLAVYKIGLKIYFGINPEKKDMFLKANGFDFDGDDSEKFITTVYRAAQAGVNIRVVYHNPDDDKGIAEALGSYFPIVARRVNWGSTGKQQMHSKFMTTKVIRGEKTIKSSVFVSTSNIDEYGEDGQPLFKVAQTGVLVTDHPTLVSAHSNYFKVIWDNAESQTNFQSQVRARHLENSLNYDDGVFSAFFFPMPEQNFDSGDDFQSGWVSRYNPITSLTKFLLENQVTRHVKVTAYYCGGSSVDPFLKRFSDSLTSAHENQTKLVHIRSAIYSKHKDPGPNCLLPAFDGQKKDNVLTHEKNFMFAFGSPVAEFYSLTGSTNLGVSEYTSKANNILRIKETTSERKIYTMFKNNFYSAYDE